MLSHTLNDVSTIVKSPKFQHWIKLQLLTCIASHWAAHLRHRFQRFIHIQVSLNVINIIESSNLSVVLKKKNPNLYKCGFICSIIMRLFNVTQIILNIGITTIFASLFWIIEIVIINCEHTTGMLENHVTEMWLDTDCQMRIICRWTLN